jgi:hypothetical protein
MASSHSSTYNLWLARCHTRSFEDKFITNVLLTNYFSFAQRTHVKLIENRCHAIYVCSLLWKLTTVFSTSTNTSLLVFDLALMFASLFLGLNTDPYPSLAVIWLCWELTDINSVKEPLTSLNLYSESQGHLNSGYIITMGNTWGTWGAHWEQVGNQWKRREWIQNRNVSHFRTPENLFYFQGKEWNPVWSSFF